MPRVLAASPLCVSLSACEAEGRPYRRTRVRRSASVAYPPGALAPARPRGSQDTDSSLRILLRHEAETK